MNSVSRSICSMILIITAAFAVNACAKHAPAPAPATENAAPEKQTDVNKVIVAKVNGAELSMDSLINMMNNTPDNRMESIEEHRKKALDNIILLECAYQRAIKLGLDADPALVQKDIDNFREKLGGEKQYTEYLTQYKKTEADLRMEVGRSIAINNIYTKEVVDRVDVPEQELKNEYESKKNLFIKPERLTAVQVYMLKNDGEASQKKAKELLARIKADPKQDPWRLVLDGTFMIRNLLVRNDRDPELYAAAKKMKPQELSGVIQTANGPQIIKLKESSPEKQLTYEEAKPEILAKLKSPLLQKRTQEWEEELKNGAKIERKTIPAEYFQKDEYPNLKDQ